MEIRILKYFLALAQEENFSRAAKQLHTTQPNLSRQLAALENRMGCKLFNRGGRKITLTEKGAFLCARAQEIINLIEKTERDLASFDHEIAGTVFIGTADSPILHKVSKAICKMSVAYPKIQCHFISGDYYDLIHDFDDGLLDFCIFTNSADLHKYHSVKLPGNHTLGILMRRDSPLAALDAIRPGDIEDKPVILSRQMLRTTVLSEWLGYDCKALHIPAAYNLPYMAAMLVEDGIGHACIYEGVTNTEGTSLCFRPFEPDIKVNLYLAWRKYQVFSKTSSKFLEFVQAEIAAE